MSNMKLPAIDYLDPILDRTRIVIDVEADNLLAEATTIWCIVTMPLVGGKPTVWSDHAPGCPTLFDFQEFFAMNTEAQWIGHNILGYDAPLLNRMLGTQFKPRKCIDTQMMSVLHEPGRRHGHSLAQWGSRLRFPKHDQPDFDHYSPEMVTYCEQDVRLTREVYNWLRADMNKRRFGNLGLTVEHMSWPLIQQQQRNGFAFDYEGASKLYAECKEKLQWIERDIRHRWPPKLERVKTLNSPRKADGSFSKKFLECNEKYPRVTERGKVFDVYDYVQFNVGSAPQRADKFLELGWKPANDRERTPTGQPKPTYKGDLVPSLAAMAVEHPEIRLITDWMRVEATARMVNTWMEAYNDTTGCIHGSLWHASTLRYTHSKPNTANIPAVRFDAEGSPLMGFDGGWTYEARGLWTTRDPDNRVLVGVDASGIQLRVLAHHLNNPDFIDAVVNGDPHSYNQEIGGFKDRRTAKTFIYAFLLGAGDDLVGSIIGEDAKAGKEVKQRFIKNFPGLQDLMLHLGDSVAKTGRIRLCDGTPLVVPEPHARLGYLLQGDESRIMKTAAVFTAVECRRLNLDVIKCGDIHDEWQNDVLRKDVPAFEELLHRTFAAAGEQFNYRVPIACEAHTGLTWSETH